MSDLLNQMADEFCRWPLPLTVNADSIAWYPRHKPDGISRTGTNLLTHAEALAMFTEIVGPKIVGLEAELAALRPQPCCMEWHTCTKACAPLAENWRMDAKRLEAENASLRAAFENPRAWVETPIEMNEAWLSMLPVGTPLFTKPEGLE